MVLRHILRGRCTCTWTRKHFSSTSRHFSYSDTISNLKIGKHTRVIFQGFTGKAEANIYLAPLQSADRVTRKTSEPVFRFLGVFAKSLLGNSKCERIDSMGYQHCWRSDPWKEWRTFGTPSALHCSRGSVPLIDLDLILR